MRPWMAQYILKKGDPIGEVGLEDDPDQFADEMAVAFALTAYMFHNIKPNNFVA
jgi:hypothetical protein